MFKKPCFIDKPGVVWGCNSSNPECHSGKNWERCEFGKRNNRYNDYLSKNKNETLFVKLIELLELCVEHMDRVATTLASIDLKLTDNYRQVTGVR